MAVELHFEFVSGLVLGLEHISGDEEDTIDWLIALHLGFARICLVKVKVSNDI